MKLGHVTLRILAKTIVWVTLSVCLFSTGVFALDPDKVITQYLHNVYGPEQGLPQQQVSSILQTRDGYLWLATIDGLVRFDGVKFTTFDTKNTPALKQSYIWTLYEDKAGTLWIGTAGGGLTSYIDGKFTTYTIKDGLAHDRINSICESRDGSLWIGTIGGLSRFKNGKFTSYTTKDGLLSDNIKSLLEDKQGNLWIGTTGGLNVYNGTSITSHSLVDDNGKDVIKPVYDMCETRDGSLWFGLYGVGLNQLKDGKLTAYTSRQGLAYDLINSLYEDHDGNLWIGALGGLDRLSNGRFTSYGPKDGLINSGVVSVYEDREGTLWVGTNGTTALNKFRDGKFLTYTSQEGLAGRVSSIFGGKSNSIWMSGAGLTQLKDGKFIVYENKDLIGKYDLRTVIEDSTGGVWIGTNGGGLWRFKDGKYTSFTKKEGLVNDTVFSLCEGADGAIWIGTEDGLNLFKDEHLTSYEKAKGMADGVVRMISKTKDGVMWFGTNNGLSYFKDGVFATYTTDDGLSHNQVRSFYEDPNGNIWIGTLGNGLSRIKQGKFSTVSSKDGLHDDVIWDILQDGRGNLWMKGNDGIFQVRESDLNDLADAKIRSIKCIAYGLADGLRSKSTGGSYPAGYKASDGRLWFPTGDGVLVVDPAHIKTNTVAPMMVIEQILVDRKVIPTGENIRVGPGKGDLEFHYTALSLIAPEKVLFKYKLEGFDSDWIDAGTRREAYYTNIPPGNYRFRVIACNNDGVWNSTGVGASFYLDPHFYQSYSFYTVVGLIFILGIATWYKVRMARLHAREKMLELRVDERTRELQQEIHERKRAEEVAEAATRAKSEFLANMSHEIRTPMNAVVGMTGLLLETELTGEQQEFVETIRTGGDALLTIINDILDFSKIESGKLDLEEHSFCLSDCLEDALYLLAAKANEKSLDLAYIIDEQTPKTVRSDVTRLRQILVNLTSNAIKFTHSGEVVITVESKFIDTPQKSRYQLRFAVRDTGIGIPKDRMDRLFKSFSQVDSSTTRQYGGTGLGLAISKRLAELMGGEMWVESQEGSGSTFHFTILADSAPSQSRAHFEHSQPQLAGKRLLIVDDNATNRRILSLQTKSWGMLSDTFASGAEALESVRKGNQYDLAILDYHMPEMDGLFLAKELRKLRDAQTLPMVMLSSGVQGRRAIAGNHQELFSAFLAKPLKPSQVFDVLTEIFAGRSTSAKQPAAASRLDKQMAERSPLRILLAEDNVVNQKVAIRILERMGYRADVAGNGLEVLDSLERQDYDVILMDVHMPEMDGLEATRRICEQRPPNERPRIIAMTANAMQGDREECLDAGMDDYISKPVQLQELQRTLEQTSEVKGRHRQAGRGAAKTDDRHSQGIIDKSVLNSLTDLEHDGEPDLILRLIDVYLEDSRLRLTAIRKAFVDSNATALEHAAHTLKGSSSNVGAVRVIAVSQELETKAGTGSLAGVDVIINRLEAELKTAAMALSTEQWLPGPSIQKPEKRPDQRA